jgi:hypothetical protein
VVDKARKSLVKRGEIIRKAALDRHAGRITTAEYLRTVVTFRKR